MKATSLARRTYPEYPSAHRPVNTQASPVCGLYMYIIINLMIFLHAYSGLFTRIFNEQYVLTSRLPMAKEYCYGLRRSPCNSRSGELNNLLQSR